MATYAVISTEALIEKFKYALENDWGYIWGTAGVMWTKALQNQLEKTTDANRESGRKYGSKWIGHMVADCSGLFAWAFAQLNSYMYHGSNTMWDKYCVAKGELIKGKRDDGQELKPGTAIFTHNAKTGKRGHVGLYIGDGWVIEASGTINGVIKSKITISKWVEWGELKRVDYGKAVPDVITDPEENKTLGTIRKGDKGPVVKYAQQLLLRWDSGCLPRYGADGDYGAETVAAVKAFQKKNGLQQDGIIGPRTWKALGANQAEQPAKKTYKVIVSGLTEDEAKDLSGRYPGKAIMEEE